nr:hypothetical protein [Tanacetum cinerariifolium]
MKLTLEFRLTILTMKITWIEAIRLFLAYASFMGFIVYRMDVKSAFLYGTIDEKVYVMQPPRFQDLEFPDRVYKVEKAMYGLHQAPRAWYDVRSANTPMNKENPWGKDRPGKDVKLHLYRSMIGSLMYLIASRLDIMFAVCACARHQVTPKECHLHAVKRIFRYLKDSDYGGSTQDKKSTTGGCQFLGIRLISWQYKKQTIVATSTTEAEYVVALWTSSLDTKSNARLWDEGSTNSTEPHHIPSPQEQHSPQHESPPPSHPTHTTEQIPQALTEPLTHRQYTRRAKRIAQSKALSPAAEELASLSRDNRQGEAFPTVSSLDPGQDRENIAKTFTFPHESSPRVTSLDADEGTQDLEISGLKARVKSLEDKNRRSAEPTQQDAPITEAVNILTSGGAAASVSLLKFFQLLVFPLLVEVFPLLVKFLPLPVLYHHIQDDQEGLQLDPPSI